MFKLAYGRGEKIDEPPPWPPGDASVTSGGLDHVEIYAYDLETCHAFWGWFLGELGWSPFQTWEHGKSWHKGGTYLVFSKTPRMDPTFARTDAGLNHLAFRVGSRAEVDRLTALVRDRGFCVLYEDRHPYAGGPDHYALYFEDPDRLKVEVVAV